MKTLKIGIIGYGKMGKTIERLAVERGHEIQLKIDRNNLKDLNSKNLSECDVAIDFSRPDSAHKNIIQCIQNGVPIVSGTTGWLERYDDVVESCIENDGTFLYASNFSIGVNLFFKLNQWLADKMKGLNNYTPSITEIHHTEKLDAPSGTAITLGNDIIERTPNLEGWILDEKGGPSELSIYAERLPNVPGTHTIAYTSSVDSIEIKHSAHSRDGFALGAVMAAEFISDKKGVYSMEDVLDL